MNLDNIIADEIMNTLNERLAEYPAVLNRHRFSLAYRIKRRQTIRTYLKGRNVSYRSSLKSTRYALLAILLAVSMLMGFCIQYAIGRFIFNAHREHSVVYISGTSEDKIIIENIYGLPSDTGFSLTERQSDDKDVISIYQSGDKKITLCQSVNDDISNFNTQYSDPEKIMINDCEGVFISENNGSCLAAWIMDGYLFMLSGNINKNMLINLAEATIVEKHVENP